MTQRPNDPATQDEVDGVMRSLPANPPRSLFYALTFRNYRLFFYGQSISVAGTWMQQIAQNWLVWELTRDAKWLGIVSGASAVPFVLFSLWGGHVADRLPRRSILIWTQIIAMWLAFGLAAVASRTFFEPQAWHITVIAALSGIVNAFNMPAQQAFVSDMIEERSALSNAIALNSLRFNMARILGPAIAGWVLVRYGAMWCFLINGISFLATIISLLLMRLPPAKPKTTTDAGMTGFRYILENHTVLRIMLLVGTGAIFTWSVSTLFPVFAAKYGVGSGGYSRMMSANGIGAALGGLALASFGHRIPRYTLIYGGAFAFCSALLLFAATTSYWVALGCLVLSGFAMIIFGISCNTKVQEDVPDELRGRVMAVYSLVFNGLMPVGGYEAGYLAAHFSASEAVRINALIAVGISLAIFIWSLIERRTQKRR
jgi:MFS family permease